MSRPSAAPRGGGKGGRPSLGDYPPVVIKLGDLGPAVDTYAIRHTLTRSAAIRQLIAKGLSQ